MLSCSRALLSLELQSLAEQSKVKLEALSAKDVRRRAERDALRQEAGLTPVLTTTTLPSTATAGTAKVRNFALHQVPVLLLCRTAQIAWLLER